MKPKKMTGNPAGDFSASAAVSDSSSGESVADLQKQVSALQAQVDALTGKTKTAPKTPGPIICINTAKDAVAKTGFTPEQQKRLLDNIVK